MSKKDLLQSEETGVNVQTSTDSTSNVQISIGDIDEKFNSLATNAVNSYDDDWEETGMSVTAREHYTGLEVRRRLIKDFKSKSGKNCYDYIIRGLIKGTPMIFNLKLKDKDLKGYELMDVYFNGCTRTELLLRHNIFRDSKTGKYTKSWQYFIYFYFDGGLNEELRVYPKSPSDGNGIMLTLRDMGFDLSL